jgi:hypothetical protein
MLADGYQRLIEQYLVIRGSVLISERFKACAMHV